MNFISKYLLQQYPREENPWKIILPVSVFIGLFLVVFQPFGLDDLEHEYKSYFLAGYGLITLLILILDLVIIPFLFPRFFKEENWTVIKEIFNYFFLLFTLGVGNLVYSTFIFDIDFNITSFLFFQSFTLLIGIIPVTAIILIKQSYLKRKNESSAAQIMDQLVPHDPVGHQVEMIKFQGDNLKEELIVSADDILFIRSDGNYITIGYLKNGKFAQAMLRNTMKYASDLTGGFSFLYPCHRSWIVNLERIARVSGNSQGLRITLESFGESIPVARKNTASFREKITGI